jgi:hypothetical protein
MPVTAGQQRAALANLFPAAANAVKARWELGRLEARAAVAHSSQALCVSLLETVAARPPGVRDQLLAALVQAAGLPAPSLGDAAVEAEVRGHRELLNELGAGTPTALDGLVTWDRGVVTIESKFTEPTFESCGQIKRLRVKPGDPRFDPADPKRAFANCIGEHGRGSDHKPTTAHLDAACRLTIADGRRTPRRYWDVAPSLFRPEVTAVPTSPCPFASSNYQLMRNIAFAHEWAARERLPYYGFVVLIVDASPNAKTLRDQFARFRRLLRDEVAARVGLLTYEDAVPILAHHREAELAGWVAARIAAVCGSAVGA